MIRTVAERLAARARPAYVGRHRRTRPRMIRVFRADTVRIDRVGASAVAVD